jgi:hypothetical protein
MSFWPERRAGIMKLTRETLRAEEYKCLMLLGLCTWFMLMGGTAARAETESLLLVSPGSYDFGEIHRLGGDVHTSFMVHVQGDRPIKIRRIWTS